MKVARFRHRSALGEGFVDGDEVLPVGALRHEAAADWPRFSLPGRSLDELSACVPQRRIPLREVQLLPPADAASRIVCIGINYRDHAAEARRQVSTRPNAFLRTLESLRGHLQPLTEPRVSEQFDYEGEIAVVIGRGGRSIARDDALGHVFGYTCFMDGSVRDFQRESLTAGKNFCGSGAMGPWIVTSDDVADPRSLELSSHVNGECLQHATADMMIHDIPGIISYVSTWMALRPGDVIATGTPSGVGLSHSPPRWLRAGDTVEVRIDAVGTLRNRVETGAAT